VRVIADTYACGFAPGDAFGRWIFVLKYVSAIASRRCPGNSGCLQTHEEGRKFRYAGKLNDDCCQ